MAEKRPSNAQLAMLRDIHKHRDPTYSLSGMSAHGGASATLHVLRQRGWILDERNLSAAGCALLELPPPEAPGTALLDGLIGQTAAEGALALDAFAFLFVGARDGQSRQPRPGRIIVRLDDAGQRVTQVTVEA